MLGITCSCFIDATLIFIWRLCTWEIDIGLSVPGSNNTTIHSCTHGSCCCCCCCYVNNQLFPLQCMNVRWYGISNFRRMIILLYSREKKNTCYDLFWYLQYANREKPQSGMQLLWNIYRIEIETKNIFCPVHILCYEMHF